MPKLKVKIRQIKKKIKITEILKEPEESLEEIVEIEDNSPVLEPNSHKIDSNPSLVQHIDSIPSQENNSRISTNSSATKDERETSTAINYATSQTSRRRSYDSSIRASGNISPQSQAAAERINPTINSSGEIIQQTNRSQFELSRHDSITDSTEPALRRSKEDERKYEIERAENYQSRRSRMM